MPSQCKVLYWSSKNTNKIFWAKIPRDPFRRYFLSTCLSQTVYSVLEIQKASKALP